MKPRLKVIVFLALLAIPFVIRFAWHTRGSYAIPPTQQPIEITLPEVAYLPASGDPVAGGGLIVIDLNHGNNLAIDELAPLQEALTARGARLAHDDGSASLAGLLRGATAYVTLAPTAPFAFDERDALQRFAQSGGRILLAADPTRSQDPVEEQQFLDLFSLFFAVSAAPAANSLASAFDAAFYDDYLYNITSNAGNYRNVRFDLTDSESPLAAEVGEVVVFAAHSIKGGEPMFTGDANTLSNVRTGETGLSPAVFAADGQALLLGDLTLLTTPYHTIADNDQFLGNLADWLASAVRTHTIADFPYMFDDAVDLVPLADGNLNSALLPFGAGLQDGFSAAGLTLGFAGVISETRDALVVGTFTEIRPIADALTQAGITVTASTSETEDGDEVISGTLDMDGFGVVDLGGLTLYLLAETPETGQTLMIVLADSVEGVIPAMQALVEGSLGDCVEIGQAVLCSDGEGGPPAGGADPEGTPPPDETGGAGSSDARVFIFSDDDGPEGVRTSADDLWFFLISYYDVTVWYASVDGIPTAEDVAGYDVYIIDSGDYAYDYEDFDTFAAFGEIDSGIVFLGDQAFPTFTEDGLAPIVDMEVLESAHPILAGLSPGVLELFPSESGVPSLLPVGETDSSIETLMTRGPESDKAGSRTLVAVEDGSSRYVVGAFAYYRLPFDIQEILILNIVAWLLGNG